MTPINILPFFIYLLISCSSSKTSTIDTKYNSSQSQTNEVKICNQTWTRTNLDVAYFKNGDPIPEAKTAEEWNKAGIEKKPAWCYYKNDPEMGKKYGKFYNWYAVNDQRGLAPKGWHIPTEEEWWTLRECIKEPYNEHSEKLKSNTDDWYVDNGKSGKGNDSTGFRALPVGTRLAGVEGIFSEFSFASNFWTATSKGKGNLPYAVRLISTGNNIYGSPTSPEFGMSVRCVKD